MYYHVTSKDNFLTKIQICCNFFNKNNKMQKINFLIIESYKFNGFKSLKNELYL